MGGIVSDSGDDSRPWRRKQEIAMASTGRTPRLALCTLNHGDPTHEDEQVQLSSSSSPRCSQSSTLFLPHAVTGRHNG